MRGVIIVGAGHGGTQAAASLRENGYDKPVTLISADDDFPYHKPPLSKSFMSTPDAALQPLRGPAYFVENDIGTKLGVTVTDIDRAVQQIRLSDGSTLDYEALVLATGTIARRLTTSGADLDGVYHLRTATDARALRNALVRATQAVIIGGGFIGLETAAMLAGRGLDVTVVELGDRLLGRAASGLIAEAIRANLEAIGVTVLTKTGVAAIEGRDGRVTSVVLPQGNALACDLVLVGIGALPDTTLADAANLQIDNGIAVNALLATPDPAIYAIGDCCSFPHPLTGKRQRLESVQNATDQGRAVARSIVGTGAPFNTVPWFWSDIGATKLQIAGLLDGADTVIPIRDPDNGALRSVYHLQGDTLLAVETLNSAGEHMLARKMLAIGKTPDVATITKGDVKQMKAYIMG